MQREMIKKTKWSRLGRGSSSRSDREVTSFYEDADVVDDEPLRREKERKGRSAFATRLQLLESETGMKERTSIPWVRHDRAAETPSPRYSLAIPLPMG